MPDRQRHQEGGQTDGPPEQHVEKLRDVTSGPRHPAAQRAADTEYCSGATPSCDEEEGCHEQQVVLSHVCGERVLGGQIERGDDGGHGHGPADSEGSDPIPTERTTITSSAQIHDRPEIQEPPDGQGREGNGRERVHQHVTT